MTIMAARNRKLPTYDPETASPKADAAERRARARWTRDRHADGLCTCDIIMPAGLHAVGCEVVRRR